MSHMRKIISLVLTVLLLTVCATAMGEIDIKAFEEANVIGKVQETYPLTMQTVTVYDPVNGEIAQRIYSYSAVDPDAGTTYTFINNDGDIEIYGRGEVYTYNYDAKQPKIYGFLDSSYEDIMISLYNQNLGEFFDGMKITEERVLDDGDITITVEGVIPADYALVGEQYAGQTLVVYYMVEPDTYIIESSDIYVRGEDGVEKRIADAGCDTDEIADLPFDIEALRNPEKTRELHVILDPGTDNEFDHVFTAPINVGMGFFIPEGYELYTDKDCATVFTGAEPDENGNFPDGVVLYCTPIK